MENEFKNYFKIEIPKLPLGIHYFDYSLHIEFFEEMGEALMEKIEGQIRVELNKAPRLIVVAYTINGKLELLCDRCLQPYWHPFSLTHKVYYTFERKMREIEEEDVFFLDKNIQYLDLSQDIYDLVTLQIPYRKVPEWCPAASCPAEIMLHLGNKTNTEPLIDDRWAALAKIKIEHLEEENNSI
ncbi:MAG: DUF177 domain-containing protein [Bacteroidia bacterium]|nr:DUF177 domain-containing protein [Bacteroidia bacterium]MDW8157458.1 DUF177 domain-containing protein [Bacteroidia bacterium]